MHRRPGTRLAANWVVVMKKSVLGGVVFCVLLAAAAPVQAGSVDLGEEWTSVVSAMGPSGGGIRSVVRRVSGRLGW